MSAEPEVFKRLPTCVVPEKYHVDYELIDLLNFRFEGSERVLLRVDEATSVITCHAVELYVFNVSVEDSASGTTQQAQQITYQTKDDSVSFHFAKPLTTGSKVALKLQFHGFLNDQLRGFYRTEYEHQGEKRVLAVTQFEACDARRAFVCWDEPALKATFEISMVTETDLVALSNAHVVETLVRPKKNAHIRKNTRSDVGGAMEKVWKFAESPVMSTYLVAMVVGTSRLDSDGSKQADADEGEFRKTVIYRLGLANDQDVIKETKKRFHEYIAGDSSALSGDLRGSVFDIETTYGEAANAKLLQELYNKSDFAEERNDCLSAMGSVSGTANKLQVLDWAVENVRSQNIHSPFISVASDKLGAQVAWQYVQDKWDVLAKKYSAMTLGYIVCGVVSRFQSEAMAVEVEAFLVNKETSGYKRRLEVALEGVRLKSAAYCRDRDTLAKWLKERAV
ncbi:33 kDa inner dynein arm light chain [Phytophthora nicotianae]|uniref:33 kDa inner dynein arm light chain n=1 Tax=Phytophthora nicotianae TaxID=4792 RepID=A0A0W8DNY1_PHYNI|nr:33 kDa inner dynein arm light chain [Phytophthora nicotianae]